MCSMRSWLGCGLITTMYNIQIQMNMYMPDWVFMDQNKRKSKILLKLRDSASCMYRMCVDEKESN